MRYSFKHPRYKICFQTRNKVWIYKNSRLRNFYKIRSKIVLKSGKNAKQFLITKNMKWTVMRRQMVPYFRRKNRFFFFYKNLFFTKQQLKSFYGGLKEYQLRNIFKKTWNVSQNFKKNVFLGALEQRLGVIFFRMKILPTMFACNQLIKHHGILVNNQNTMLINFRVSLGDIVSIPETLWLMFYKFIYERLSHRFFGDFLLRCRRSFVLKKIQYFRLKKKRFYILNLSLRKIFKKHIIYSKKVKLFLFKQFCIVGSNKMIPFSFKQNCLKILIIIFIRRILLKTIRIKKYMKYLRKWHKKAYFFKMKFFLFNIISLNQNLRNLLFIYMKIIWATDFLNQIQHINEHADYTNEQRSFIIKYSKKLFAHEFFKDEFALTQSVLRNQTQIIQTVQRGFKIFYKFKNKSFKYKKFFIFLLRKLRYRKFKKKVFKNFCKKPHWYIPAYLELDFNTLRTAFVRYPQVDNVHFGFLCSFKKIISFYKERAL